MALKEEDKVWVIPTQEVGTIKVIKGNKYEVFISRVDTLDGFDGYSFVEEGYILCMAYELLPYTEGMELLYE